MYIPGSTPARPNVTQLSITSPSLSRVQPRDVSIIVFGAERALGGAWGNRLASRDLWPLTCEEFCTPFLRVPYPALSFYGPIQGRRGERQVKNHVAAQIAWPLRFEPPRPSRFRSFIVPRGARSRRQFDRQPLSSCLTSMSVSSHSLSCRKRGCRTGAGFARAMAGCTWGAWSGFT